MTSITYDARPPVVAIVGDFNPAIFSRFWVATHLHSVPVGGELTVSEAVIEVDPGGLVKLDFIKNVALKVEPKRIEIFALSADDGALDQVATVAQKIFEKLPHTPVRAVGSNFRWSDADLNPIVADFFDTAEGLEASYEAVAREVSFQTKIANGLMNISRYMTTDSIRFDFNYHRDVKDSAAAEELLTGELLRGDYAASWKVLQDFYKYTDVVVEHYASGIVGE